MQSHALQHNGRQLNPWPVDSEPNRQKSTMLHNKCKGQTIIQENI